MALFERLAARVEQRARAVADQRLNIAEATLVGIPDVVVRREGEELVISGRGLMRRWLGDARMRLALWPPSTSFAGPPPRAGEDCR